VIHYEFISSQIRKEDTMAVEVLILRKIMETMAKEVSPLIVKLSQEKAEYAIYDPLVGGIIPASNIQGEK